MLYADDLVKKDKAHIWHPFTQMKTARSPIPIVRAKGTCLYDANGNAYLDAISSWWVNLHGHGHPYIAEKIKQQADKLEHVLFAGFTHPPAIELAERLLALLPGKMSKVFYSDNGSTAVETALKIALQYWYNLNSGTQRLKIVCLRNSYHGDTFGAMSVAGKNDFNKPFWSHLFDVEMIDVPFVGHEEQSLGQLQKILNLGDVACFIFEPLVLGVGGMRIYPPKGLDELLRLCRENDVITIADEVMTGFGRTNTIFACEQLCEQPDIICLSKGITGGFLPLGATVCTERIFDAFWGDTLHQALLHGHSYTANPLACSSALASLDLLLNEECYMQRNRIALSHEQFCKKWKDHPMIKRCESIGTILAIEYQAEKSSYFQAMGKQLYHFFLDRGVVLRPLGNVIYVLPPYCISEEELNRVYDCIEMTYT